MLLTVALLLAPAAPAQGPAAAERDRWARHADRVTIVRDEWGSLHLSVRRTHPSPWPVSPRPPT